MPLVEQRFLLRAFAQALELLMKVHRGCRRARRDDRVQRETCDEKPAVREQPPPGLHHRGFFGLERGHRAQRVLVPCADSLCVLEASPTNFARVGSAALLRG